jgi:hypothetical protein
MFAMHYRCESAHGLCALQRAAAAGAATPARVRAAPQERDFDYEHNKRCTIDYRILDLLTVHVDGVMNGGIGHPIYYISLYI